MTEKDGDGRQGDGKIPAPENAENHPVEAENAVPDVGAILADPESADGSECRAERREQQGARRNKGDGGDHAQSGQRMIGEEHLAVGPKERIDPPNRARRGAKALPAVRRVQDGLLPGLFIGKMPWPWSIPSAAAVWGSVPGLSRLQRFRPSGGLPRFCRRRG